MSLFEIVEDKIFAKRIALSTECVPDKLIGRDRQITQVASIFAPALKEDKPSSMENRRRKDCNSEICPTRARFRG